jgi:hypothetical protein
MASSSANETPLARSYQTVACPKCHAKFRFYRRLSPPINEHGFESYNLECMRCGASILGIIEPVDNELVLSIESSRRKRPIAEKGERTPKTYSTGFRRGRINELARVGRGDVRGLDRP